MAAEHLLAGRRNHRSAVNDYQSAALFLDPVLMPVGLRLVLDGTRDNGWRPDFDEPYSAAVRALRENLAAFKRVLVGLAERGTQNEARIRALINGD